MRFSTRFAGLCAAFTLLFAIEASAGSLLLTFPEPTNPPAVTIGPFPQPPLTVGSVNFTVPHGERVVAAVVSGFWGTTSFPESTAGVDVYLDDILVAQCVKPTSGCWEQHSGQLPWSYTLTENDLKRLADGNAKLTVVQTSDVTVRLGVTTLIIQLGPAETVPTLSTLGLMLLSAALGLAALASWRLRARRS